MLRVRPDRLRPSEPLPVWWTENTPPPVMKPQFDWSHATFVFEFGACHWFPRGRCGFHQHPVLEIIYHAKGRGMNFIRNGDTYPFEQDSAIVYPPFVVHDQLEYTSGLDYCLFLSTPAPLHPCLREPVRIRVVNSLEIRRECAALARGVGDGSALQHSALNHRATALLLRLLDAAQQTGAGTKSNPLDGTPVSIAHAYLLDHFAESPSLRELAKVCGISSHHLRHLFQAQYRLTPKQFILRLQIDQARYLLARSSMSIKAIAAQCGFQTERYFCTVFRRITGQSPGHARHGA